MTSNRAFRGITYIRTRTRERERGGKEDSGKLTACHGGERRKKIEIVQ